LSCRRDRGSLVIVLDPYETTFRSHSEQQTLRLAERLAAVLVPGDVLALEGELGTGKTVFVRGIARGLGILGPLRSPSFVVVSHLKGRLELFHVDAYRLSEPEELLQLGFEGILEADGIVAVEWADRVASVLPARRLQIRIVHLDPGRQIQIKDLGLNLSQRPGVEALENPGD